MTSSYSSRLSSDKRKLLYIASPNFSGSTLLTAVLAGHREISTVGELKASAIGDVEDYTCSCGQDFLECDFWSEVEEQMKTKGHDFNLSGFGTHFRSASPFADRIFRALYRGPVLERVRQSMIQVFPSIRKEHSKIIGANQDAVEIVTSLQGGSMFLDGSKDPNRLYYFDRSNLFDIRVLHLVRDGRGVSNSMRRHYGISLREAAGHWKQKETEIGRAMRHFGNDRVLRVGYEDFCRSPVTTLDDIADFCGFSAYSDEKSMRSDPTMHMLGNNMRLASATSIVLDEKWRHAFDKNDHLCFESIAGGFNRQLGYDDDSALSS